MLNWNIEHSFETVPIYYRFFPLNNWYNSIWLVKFLTNFLRRLMISCTVRLDREIILYLLLDYLFSFWLIVWINMFW